MFWVDCLFQHVLYKCGCVIEVRLLLLSGYQCVIYTVHLDVPRVILERSDSRAIACAGPTLWNSLSLEHGKIIDNNSVLKLI